MMNAMEHDNSICDTCTSMNGWMDGTAQHTDVQNTETSETNVRVKQTSTDCLHRGIMEDKITECSQLWTA